MARGHRSVPPSSLTHPARCLPRTRVGAGPAVGWDCRVPVTAMTPVPAGSVSGALLVRRMRLAADRRTPAAGRAVVRSVLEQAGLEHLLDAALLLTTELSANAVVHAGTALDLEVVTDEAGLTVTVVDDARGVLASSSSEPSAS